MSDLIERLRRESSWSDNGSSVCAEAAARIEAQDAEITRLREENARPRETLREIARQPLQEEMDENDLERAAFDDGYDHCVRNARAAYKGGE